jgi:LPS export ABC transporter permease LptF/LPS export ABC transporter permease LptG
MAAADDSAKGRSRATMRSMKGLPSPRPRILDRYLVREMLAPFALGLLVFTFVLLIDQIPRLLGILVARSADLETILKVFLCLLPSIFAVTIPMAFLLGVLLAFGRMAADSEIVALRAVGVSPTRLLVPVMMLAGATGLLTFYINAVALPAANQAYRELVFSLVVSGARTKVKPRAFTDDLLPGRMMLYVSDIASDTGQWKDLLIYDTRQPGENRLILAKTGELVIDKAKHSVRVELRQGSQHSFFPADPAEYRPQPFGRMGFDLPFDEFFPKRNTTLARGDREMTLPELARQIGALKAQGKPRSEWGRFAVEWHKKFAIPTACIVFGLLGLALSLGSKKEARSSAFALSIAVIFVYYILIRLGEQAGDTGMMSPFLSMWGANLVLGAMAIALLWLNLREAAFDPLDPSHYLTWVPKIRRQRAARPAPGRTEAPGVAARPVVILRIPRLTLRFPSLLDRYIARNWVSHFLLVLLAFASIYFLAEFMDLVDDFQHNRVKGVVVVHYYAFHIHQIFFTVAPVAILVGVLVTLGILARRNEVTAMKAGGISVYRAALPVVGMGLLASLSLYGMQEFLLPQTNKVAAMDFNVIKGRPAQSSDQFDRRWILASDSRFYNFDYMVERPGPRRAALAEPEVGGEFSLYGFSIYDVNPKTWNLRERLFASRAAWNPATRSYDLERGWRLGTGAHPSFRRFDAERVRVVGPEPGGEIEPPGYFKREKPPSDTMGFAELRTYVASLEARGFDVAGLKVQLHRKLAFPMVGLIMTLLGVPFSFVVARRGALYGIGVSIVIAIVYWAFLGTFEALGNNALLHPALAAWAPNVMFGAAGLYLLLTLDT